MCVCICMYVGLLYVYAVCGCVAQQLRFFVVSVRDTDPCNESYVEVLNGYMASSPSVGRYCQSAPRFFTSQSNHLRLIYHSDAAVARSNRIHIMYRVLTRGTYSGTRVNTLTQLFTRATLCIARSLLWCGVRPSVCHVRVLCPDG